AALAGEALLAGACLAAIAATTSVFTRVPAAPLFLAPTLGVFAGVAPGPIGAAAKEAAALTRVSAARLSVLAAIAHAALVAAAKATGRAAVATSTTIAAAL